jgi:hypothetical protein
MPGARLQQTILPGLVLFAVTVFGCFENATAAPPEVAARATKRVVEGRELIQKYVTTISDKYPAVSPEYRTARTLYGEALNRYDSWATLARDGIRHASTEDVGRTDPYRSSAVKAGAAAKTFVDYVSSKTASARAGSEVFDSLADIGVKVWTASRNREATERNKDADAFYEDVKWDEWDVLAPPPSERQEPADSKGPRGLVEEAQLGDPPGRHANVGETLRIEGSTLSEIDGLVTGESKGAKVDSKVLAMETLHLAREYARIGVSRHEPPTPTKVRDYLALYGLPFKYASGEFVPYCAAGVGYAAARAHYRLAWPKDHPSDLAHADPGDNSVALRTALADVTRDYCQTHPSTRVMLEAAGLRKHSNGEAMRASPSERPEPGWLVFFNWKGGKTPQHVGIVDTVESEGRILRTVEFNTSDGNPSNGGRVEAKTRSVRYVVGYVRTYPSASQTRAVAGPAPSAKERTDTGIASSESPRCQEKHPRRRALLVGISDYETGLNPADGFGHLNTGPDLEHMRYVLETYYGFGDSDIRTLKNADATKENIESEFRRFLICGAAPGDTTVFYYTGHGHQVLDTSGDEVTDGLDEVLVTWLPKDKQALPDEERHASMYMLDDTYETLLSELSERMREPGGRVSGSITVIFDSCHSGSATKGPLIRKGREWDTSIDGPKPTMLRPETASGWLSHSKNQLEGITFISASESGQLSYMMPDSATNGSVLTYYLTEFLVTNAREATFRLTPYSDLYRWVSAKASGLRAQNPQIEGNQDTPIFGDGRVIAKEWRPTVRRVLMDPLRLELNVGTLHGVTAGSRFAVYKAVADVTNPAARLAEVEITEAGPITAVGRITKTATPPPDPSDFQGGQAVVLEYKFDGRPLKVFIQPGLSEPQTKTLTGAIATQAFITTRGVSEKNFDVLLGWKDRFYLRRAGGSTVDLGAALTAQTLQKRLLAEWRWRRFAELTLPGPPKVRIDLVRQDGSPLERSEGGTTVIRPGDTAKLTCTNSTGRPMFISLIYLKSSGEIETFPTAEVVNAQQPLDADNKPRRLFDISDIEASNDPETEMLKVIATPQSVDFTGMSYSAEERKGKSKGPRNPLGNLLFGLVDAEAKSLTIKAPEIDDWYIDQVVYEIRPKGKNVIQRQPAAGGH